MVNPGNSSLSAGLVTAVVPALNEENNIAAAISSIKTAADEFAAGNVEIIVVNDGSTDATAAPDHQNR